MTRENAQEIIVTVQPPPTSTTEKILAAFVFAGLAWWIIKGPFNE